MPAKMPQPESPKPTLLERIEALEAQCKKAIERHNQFNKSQPVKVVVDVRHTPEPVPTMLARGEAPRSARQKDSCPDLGKCKAEVDENIGWTCTNCPRRPDLVELTDKQENEIAFRIIELLDGAPMGRALHTLEEARSLMLNCHTVQTSGRRYVAHKAACEEHFSHALGPMGFPL
jgi:hypothetical protein